MCASGRVTIGWYTGWICWEARVRLSRVVQPRPGSAAGRPVIEPATRLRPSRLARPSASPARAHTVAGSSPAAPTAQPTLDPRREGSTDELGDRRTHPLGDTADDRGGGADGEDRELVVSAAADDVALPGRREEGPSHRAQRFVACLPAERVVELVEVVEVDRDDRERVPHLGAALLERAAADQPGQRVGRHLGQSGGARSPHEVRDGQGRDPADAVDQGDLVVAEGPIASLGHDHRADRGAGVDGARDPVGGRTGLSERLVPGDRSQDEGIGAEEIALPDGGPGGCAVLAGHHHRVAFDPVHPDGHRGRCAGLEKLDDRRARGGHHGVDVSPGADPCHRLEEPVRAVAAMSAARAAAPTGAAELADVAAGPAMGGARHRGGTAKCQGAGRGNRGPGGGDRHGQRRDAGGPQAVEPERAVAPGEDDGGEQPGSGDQEGEGCRPGAP